MSVVAEIRYQEQIHLHLLALSTEWVGGNPRAQATQLAYVSLQKSIKESVNLP